MDLSTLSPVSPSPSKGKGSMKKEGLAPLLDTPNMGLERHEQIR